MKTNKQMTVFDLVSIGVGSVIGAGIFSMLGTGIYFSGRSVVLALIFGMLLVFVEYIRPFILSAVFVLPGGAYDQSSLTLPPVLIGAGALITIIGNFGTSVSGLAIASYIAQLVPVLGPYQQVMAFIIMTAFYAISIGGNKFLAKFQNIMAVCMYAALALFIIFGFVNRDSAAVSSAPYMPQGVTGLLMGTAMMSFACNGATILPNYTKDAENPKKTIPMALALSTIVGAGIYALLGFAATSALPYDQIAGQNMGFIAQQIMPGGVYVFFVVGGAIFALATTILGGIGGLKWPILSSAQDGWLPHVFTKTTKNGYPWVIMLLMYLISAVPIIGGFSLDSIVSLILVPAAISSIAGNIINWNLPKQFPKAWSENSLHLSVGGYHVLLVLSTIAAVVLTVFTLATQQLPMILANLAMTAFLFIFAAVRYRSGKVHLASRDIYKE